MLITRIRYYANAGLIDIICLPGSESGYPMICTSCRPGYYSKDGTDCKMCPYGTYSNVTGATSESMPSYSLYIINNISKAFVHRVLLDIIAGMQAEVAPLVHLVHSLIKLVLKIAITVLKVCYIHPYVFIDWFILLRIFHQWAFWANRMYHLCTWNLCV